jgi:hypothetical protein
MNVFNLETRLFISISSRKRYHVGISAGPGTVFPKPFFIYGVDTRYGDLDHALSPGAAGIPRPVTRLSRLQEFQDAPSSAKRLIRMI